MVMAVRHPTRIPDVLCQLATVQTRAHPVTLVELTPVRPGCLVRNSVAQPAGLSARSSNPLSLDGCSHPRPRTVRLKNRSNVIVSANEGGTANTSQKTWLPEQDGSSALDGGYPSAEDIEILKAAISAAEQKANVLEKAQAETLEALAAAENKARQYSATMIENTEKAFAEVEVAKLAFQTELQAAVEEKSTLAAELKSTKREAIDLALKVERIAEQSVYEATFQSAEDARMKLAAAETLAADASFQIEEKIRRAAEEAASSVLAEAKSVIQEAIEASEKAKQNAERAEAALLQRLFVLDNLATSEGTIASLREANVVLELNLKAKEGEAERLRAELEAVLARALSAETRLSAAEAALQQLKAVAERAALEREESTIRALDGLKAANAEREQATRLVFQGEIEALKTAVLVARKAEKVQEQSFLRRCEAVEKSLRAAESYAEAWKARALAIEALVAKKEGGVDLLGNANALSAGRIDASLGQDKRKWDLLANGPRRETPEWMRRKIESGLQGLPPRETKPINAFVEADVPLYLPTPEDVWSIANAKIKTDDLFAKQAAEKEALDTQKKQLDSQRKALERALKKGARRPKSPEEADIKLEPGTGSGREVVFQGFNWESWRRKWYLELAPRAADLAKCGITSIWLPPPTESVSPQGYMPGDLYNLNSAYGTQDELKICIEEMHNNDILVLGDVVLNHRCAQKQNPEGIWNIFGGKLAWGPEAIVKDDPNFRGQGNPSTGDFFHAAPNIDHAQPFVRKDITEWMNWLRTDIGYDGWRLDFVRGFWGGYVKEYIEATNPVFAIGEYWDSLGYEGGNVCYNQDPHRQRIINWINATGGSSSAFDVTTKGILHAALHNEYWRLIDPQGKPPGVVGWWPSRAVTFLENHDTGSTQGHWPFPRDKLMQGYAYILTHPGTPVIFYDHFYDFGLHDSIAELIAARTKTGVHCRSTIKILHANVDGYVAQVGENLVMKLGRYDWNPSKQNNLVGSWERLLDKGSDYQLWQRT